MSDSSLNTPPWFLDLVRKLGPIGLDPCSNETSMVKADTCFTIKDNGLIQPWLGHGLVFMNPPHSQSPMNIEPWMEKAHSEFIDASYHLDVRDQFLGLVPSKTGPAWFHDHTTQFVKCFLRGRIKFWQGGYETEQSGKFDSLVLYKGIKGGLFKHIFGAYGWCP